MNSFAKSLYDNISYELKILGFQTNFVKPFLFIITWKESNIGIICSVSIDRDNITYETALWNRTYNETIYDENIGYLEFKMFSTLDSILEEVCELRRYLDVNTININYSIDELTQGINKL